LQSIAEEMATANEELASTNEEMIATNEELEQSHRELLMSENRFRTLIRQAPFGICIIRAEDLMILDVNDNYLELVGKSRHELENRLIWDAVPEAAESYAPVMKGVISTGKAFIADEHELMLVRNGVPESVFVDFVYEPVVNTAGTVITIMVVGTEVTDKVMSRRKIEDIEERIRLAVEAGDIGTYDFDYGSGSLTTSQRFNKIYGITAEDISREKVLATYHPGDQHLSAEAHQAALSTGKINYEARVIHPDQSLHWVRIQGNVYFDEQGARKRALGTVIDITDYKSLQQQKDDFISIASHELKTPITSLKASLQLMERMARDNDTSVLPFLLDQSTRSMSKISELVEDLLNVARIREGQIMLNKTHFTISHLLNDCCNHVRAEGKYNLILEGDKALAIFADEQRIDQVVVNFVNNAVKYAPASRDIHLIVSREGNNAKVSVKDGGPGIPADKIAHLFDRFYRVDDSGTQASGLGLGLYISADIIARHNGKIGVDSELGKGSTFWFTLPLET
ncbi:MAG: PAS domain S-box protein, partial [Sphingobacteriales bacterium]